MYEIKILSPVGAFFGAVGEGCLSSLCLVPESAKFHLSSDRTDGLDCPIGERLAAELSEYFSGTRRVFTIPVKPAGSDFQLAVWDALRRIPYGEVRTYGEIAAEVGHPRAARAVGVACNRNPIMLLIPCHRVVSASGIGGFAHGNDRKRALLALEGVYY